MITRLKTDFVYNMIPTQHIISTQKNRKENFYWNLLNKNIYLYTRCNVILALGLISTIQVLQKQCKK